MENWVSLWSVIGLAKFGWFIGMKHFLQLCILYLYCLPLPVSKFQSPFYLLNKQYPDYSCLRVFGQRCFPLLPMTQHHKLDQSHYLVYFCDIMIGTKATSSCISSNFAESSSLTYSVCLWWETISLSTWQTNLDTFLLSTYQPSSSGPTITTTSPLQYFSCNKLTKNVKLKNN